MKSIYYYLLIPFSLSTLGCTIFLYFYCRYQAIRHTFLMKHMVFIQVIDLILSISMIVQYVPLYEEDTFCLITFFINEFFFILQSYWLAIISFYVYQVVCMNKDRRHTYFLRSFLACSIISIGPPILTLSLNCIKYKSDICMYVCVGTRADNIFFGLFFHSGFLLVFFIT